MENGKENISIGSETLDTQQVCDNGVSTIEPGPSQTPGAVFFWSAVLAFFIVTRKALAVIETVEAVHVYV